MGAKSPSGVRRTTPFASYATRVGYGRRERGKRSIAALANGELIANGVHPGTGVRSELHPTEWARTGLVLDVRNGDLIEGGYSSPIGKHTVRWSAIALRAAIPQNKSWERIALGRGMWNEDVSSRGGQWVGSSPDEKAYRCPS